MGADAAAIDLGLTGRVNNGGVGQWIQARHSEVDSTYYDLLLNPIGGNVGIGVTDPSAKLHVRNYDEHPITIDEVNAYESARFASTQNGRNISLLGSAETVSNYIGTLDDDHSLRFFTTKQGQHRTAMTISEDGNVGIGTTSPSGKLQVNDFRLIGGYTAQTTATGVTVQTSGDMTGVLNNGDTVKIDGNTYTISNVISETFTLNSPAPRSGSGLAIYVYDDALILKDGNVGIGTTSPAARLEVDYVASTQIGLTLNGSNTALNNAIKLTDASDNEVLLSINAGNFGITGGDVGIGTATPGAKLEIKTETIWGTYTNEALTISNIGSSGNVNQQHGLGRIKWETNNTIGASIDAIRNLSLIHI